MRVIFNRLVPRDVQRAMKWYREEAGVKLANEFFAELMARINDAAAQPTRFHPVGDGLRRGNLDRFPYHFLYRIKSDHIRVIVVKFDRRNPQLGRHRI